MAKKLTLKELSTLQESATQELNAGKSKADIVSRMLSDGIDDLTAHRIADSAEARTRRDHDEPPPPPRNLFNYSVLMGGVFFAVGSGIIAYVWHNPQSDYTMLVLGGVAVLVGLFRIVTGALPSR